MVSNITSNPRIVKVCGMRDPDNIRAVEALGIDWMGFIFWPRSSRYVDTLPAYLPTQCKRVGVFVDSPVEDVVRHIETYRLDLIQLHGHETPEYLRQLRGCKIIKALSINSPNDVERYKYYEGLADYFLFDTRCATVGGSGTQFDWSLLSAYCGQTPFLLSGGIGPEDAEQVRTFRHPHLAGIDLNSRFESAPAHKDIQKLKQFLHEI